MLFYPVAHRQTFVYVQRPLRKMNNDTENQDGNQAGPEATPSANPESENSSAQETLTAQQITELKAKASKADEYWDRLLRLTADHDNFKKRAAREKQDAIKYGNESLLQKLIPIVDNFEMALAAGNNSDPKNAQSLQQGVAMIGSLLRSTLAEAGLEEIDAQNKPFDPNLHEAVSQQENEDLPEGQVIQQLRKGYKLKERL
ncbi:MAG: hypothetical protein JWN25_349, partial [Verrucomicrobiales bacterium]|nr:hypothetical protein [Verrucomicrobiales bacterium]